MNRNVKTVLSAALLGLVVSAPAAAQPQNEAMLILDRNAQGAGDAQLILLAGPDDAAVESLSDLEPRTVLIPPGEGQMLPVSATAVIKISTPGSYVLGGNVYGIDGKHGIEVTKSNVTLDLNGFALIGSPGSKSGINAPSGVVNVKIHNGAIRGWGERGISGKKMSASEVSDVRVGNCKWHGIHLGQGLVSGCTSRANGTDGIHVEHGRSVIRDCTAEFNRGDGLDAGMYSTVTNVTVVGNGEKGMSCGDGAIVSGCTASENDGTGFSCGHSSSVTRCSAELNGAMGIGASGNSMVTACTAGSNSSYGILVGPNSKLNGCTANNNGNVGIRGSNNSVVVSCGAYGNSAGGIDVGNGAHVRGCTAGNHSAAGEYGIRMLSDATVEGNTCDENHTGIIVTLTDCRVDGNTLVDGGVGIRVASPGNVIVRNSSSCPVDYDIIGGNKVGAISTNPATAGPWDNFDF